MSSEIERPLLDRAAFDAFIYTPWQDALVQLEERREDAKLTKYLEQVLPQGIPEIMRGKKSMVLFRHIATSNYEVRRFMIAADSLEGLQPLILEYTNDQFNDRNEGKYFLGKLCFHKGRNHKAEMIWENARIIDFNGSNNRPINSIKTIWGESLVDFHHGLFSRSFPKHAGNISDISDWLHTFGPRPKEYYKPFLSLFLRDGILFENFHPGGKETTFTRDIILPALTAIREESGYKPLIVTIEPTEIEEDRFWHAHAYHEKAFLEEKQGTTPTV